MILLLLAVALLVLVIAVAVRLVEKQGPMPEPESQTTWGEKFEREALPAAELPAPTIETYDSGPGPTVTVSAPDGLQHGSALPAAKVYPAKRSHRKKPKK